MADTRNRRRARPRTGQPMREGSRTAMQLRSWMATLVLAAGSLGPARLPIRTQQTGSDQGAAQDGKRGSGEGTGPTASARTSQRSATGRTPVELNLLIAGLGHDGCEVEVKPGNAARRFQPQTSHVGSSGKRSFVFRDVEVRAPIATARSRSPSREPGQAPKTIFRGFRIASRPRPANAARAPSPSPAT